MKMTRQSIQFYYATGYMGEYLTQYSIVKMQEGWKITRVYGYGPEFSYSYKTKRECIELIKAYAD